MASPKELEVTHRLALAQEKLEVAELLYEDGKYADAVSRAYYAICHAARGVLFLKDDAREFVRKTKQIVIDADKESL